MIAFHDALDILLKTATPLPLEEVTLEKLWYRILGEEIISDINLPSFHKSAMDGYACRKEDLSLDLRVLETLHAGFMSNTIIEPGTCIKIMTGAPVPQGADVVIMQEDTLQVGDHHIRFARKNTKSNICLLGEDVKIGEHLLNKGLLLLPHHIAVLASAGYTKAAVHCRPQIAILSTGSELVEPGVLPSGAAIRNSNAYNIMAQLEAMKVQADYAGIVPDQMEIIRERLIQLLENHDVIILTGGASAGEHDFVPVILEAVKMELQFDSIAIQPGKPVSFGAGNGKFCFGLSGNPVSSFLQFELLVKPFLYQLMGHRYDPPIQLVPLAHSIERKKADRLKFFPVKLNAAGQAEEIRFNGSAHIAGLSHADGLGLFPKDCYALAAEELIEVLRIK